MPIRVLLVDDHPVVRAGYARLLEGSTDIEVVAEADTVEAGFAAFVGHAPDVTVTDLALPGSSGLDLVRRIRARDAVSRVLIFSVHDECVMVESALRCGAAGFVTKRSAPAVLREAVRSVFRGLTYLSEDVRGSHGRLHLQTEPSRVGALSPREFEMFRLLARGHTAAECASLLKVTVKTAANYQALIKEKLGVTTVAALVHLALRVGVVRSPDAVRE